MIKTAIAGAETPMSGELIRILVNHPDVELVWAFAPALTGHPLSEVHHGLIGETDLCFTSSALPQNVDVLFIDAANPANLFDISTIENDDIQIIDMSHSAIPPFDDEQWLYGLSEIHRKNIVRQGRRVVVPGSIPAVALIALYPLASNLMLNGNIRLAVSCPPDIATPQRIKESEQEITAKLKDIQLGFNGSVNIDYTPDNQSLRAITVKTEIPCSSDVETIHDLFENCYDDHNFTFITGTPVDPDEVVGTDKCIVSVQFDSNLLTITGVADCRMRGGAGDAVHAFNLLQGLHEKTGLNLKAHKY